MTQTKKHPECPICGQASVATRKGGLCSACGSWWRRVQLYSGRELAGYMFRLHRFGLRAGMLDGARATGLRLHREKGGKVLPFSKAS